MIFKGKLKSKGYAINLPKKKKSISCFIIFGQQRLRETVQLEPTQWATFTIHNGFYNVYLKILFHEIYDWQIDQLESLSMTVLTSNHALLRSLSQVFLIGYTSPLNVDTQYNKELQFSLRTATIHLICRSEL